MDPVPGQKEFGAGIHEASDNEGLGHWASALSSKVPLDRSSSSEVDRHVTLQEMDSSPSPLTQVLSTNSPRAPAQDLDSSPFPVTQSVPSTFPSAANQTHKSSYLSACRVGPASNPSAASQTLPSNFPSAASPHREGLSPAACPPTRQNGSGAGHPSLEHEREPLDHQGVLPASPAASRTREELSPQSEGMKGGPLPGRGREGDAQAGAKPAEGADGGASSPQSVLNGEEAEGQGPVSDPKDEDSGALDRRASMALLLLARGKAGEALEVVEASIALQQLDAGALCVRGRCLEALGNNPGAFASYSAALQSDPEHLDTLMASAQLYKSCGMLEEAAADLRVAVKAHPSEGPARRALAMVLTDLGTKLKLSSNIKAGLANYHEAIAVCACYAPAYYNIGVIYSENREYDKALEYYRLAVGAGPGYAEAHCNMGVIYKEQGRLEDAVAAYEKALGSEPNFTIVHTNLAIALTELGTKAKLTGDVGAGIALYEKALAHSPKYADALYNLGVAFGETGRTDRAIFMYEMAVAFNPGCVEAYNNLGVILREQGRLEKALACYQAALQLRPNFPQGLNNLAVFLTAQGKARDALHLLQAALSACPTYAEAYNNLGVLQRDVGAIQDAISSYEKCMALQPNSRSASQNRLLALNYIYAGDHPLLCAAHREWGRDFQASVRRLPPVPRPHNTSQLPQPLVVGYMSPDFVTHSVSYFAEAPLTYHNPARVRHIAYSCVAKGDSRTARLRAAVEAAGGTWRNVAHLSEPELAALVREDGVHILVDLTGHTANNRLATLAMRPAPIQVTWIGYPNSTGLHSVDYRLTDGLADPPTTLQTFTEELVRLPGCFLCYTPPPEAPPVAPPPSALAGFITFGSFNALAKMTPQVLRVWGRILQVVPNSRLLLKNKPFACPAARQHFLNLLEEEGVAAARVDLLPLQAATSDHLDMYSHLDISLDPFPYAGTTTTCESLYMGVPCIALAGRGHAHNVGVSLMAAVGLGEDWVARTEDEYVELALQHASDLPALAALRETLRERMLSSPLCDAPTFVDSLEEVYEAVYHRWLAGEGNEPPALSDEAEGSAWVPPGTAGRDTQEQGLSSAQENKSMSCGAGPGRGISEGSESDESEQGIGEGCGGRADKVGDDGDARSVDSDQTVRGTGEGVGQGAGA